MEQVDEECRKHSENSEEIQQARNGKDKEVVLEKKHYEEIGSGEENEEKLKKMTPKIKKKKIKEEMDENDEFKEDKNREKNETAKVDNCRKKKYLNKLYVEGKNPDRDSEKENHDEDENMVEEYFEKGKENNSNEEQDEKAPTKKYYSFSSNSSLYFSSRSSESFSQTPSYSSEDNYPPEMSPVFEIYKKLSAIDLVGKEKSHSEDSPKDTSCTEEFFKGNFSMKVKIEETTSTEEYPYDTPYSKKSSIDVSSENDEDTTLPSSGIPTKLLLSSGVDQKKPPPKELTGSSSPKTVSRRRSRKKYRKRYPRKKFRTKYIVKSCDKPRRAYRRKPHPIIKFRNTQSDAEDSSELEINPTSSNDDCDYRLRNKSHVNGDSKTRKRADNTSKSLEKEGNKIDDYCKRKRNLSHTSKETDTLRDLESFCSLDTGNNSISMAGNADCYLDGYTATAMSNMDYDVVVEDYEEVVVETEVNYYQWDHKSESDKIAEHCDTIPECPGRVDEVKVSQEFFITEANSSSGGKMDVGMKSRKTKNEESQGTESDRDRKQKRVKTEDLSDENGNWL